jgi:hypothetical protein
MNDSIRLDLVDAIELAETLEYLMERLERVARPNPAGLLANDDDTYSLDDLRTDVVRLTNKLLTSPNDNFEIGG